jgi:hypothetical protein
VVEDQAQGGWMPGGPSLYSARTALALGAEVSLISRIPAGYDRSVLAGLDVHGFPARVAPRYANTYTPAGKRTQLLLNEGEPLDPAAATLDRPIDGLIVAPAYHELAGLPAMAGPVVAVSLQGVLRTVDAQGHVLPTPDPEAAAAPFIRPGCFAFFSEEDSSEPEALARFIAGCGAIALLTRGFSGAMLFRGDAVTRLDAIAAAPVEPTGAGDCFATAFVVRYIETGDVGAACLFALAAGALAVESYGLAGVPTRAAIEERLAKVAA